MLIFFFYNALGQGHPHASCRLQRGRKTLCAHRHPPVWPADRGATVCSLVTGWPRWLTVVWAVCLCNPLCSRSATDISLDSQCSSAIPLFAPHSHSHASHFLLLPLSQGLYFYFYFFLPPFSLTLLLIQSSLFSLSLSFIPLCLFPDLPRWALAGSRRWQLY